jgi:8-oxo-dGTP pyrophosphatase MutT (NUDIX family)
MQESEKILRVEHSIPWLPRPNESQIVRTSRLPPLELVSTALVLAFSGDSLLMTDLRKRGRDIPGGHVEPGEHPEETAHREVREETGATLHSLTLLAYQRLRLLGPQPEGYSYPYPDCYQVFYWAQVASLEDFLPTEEALGRALFSPQEARELAWVQHNPELYQIALERNSEQARR